MKQLFGMLAAAMVAGTLSTPAHAEIDVKALQTNLQIQALANRSGLNWHIGDKANYSLDIGGFIKGTSNNFVREDTGTDFVMEQDMVLMGQNQKIEAWVNKSNGQIDKLLANGQEQSVPKSDVEIVDTHEDHITVAAGAFDCIYAKIRDKSDGKITEAWINPKAVPMTGVLKALADSQMGKVDQEATSMSFANPPNP